MSEKNFYAPYAYFFQLLSRSDDQKFEIFFSRKWNLGTWWYIQFDRAEHALSDGVSGFSRFFISALKNELK